MCVVRYLFGHELLCVVCLYKLPHESPGCCCIGATLEKHHNYVVYEDMLWLYYGHVVASPTMLLQPGMRLCYSCLASKERMNISAAPMTPHISLKLLSSHLAYSGFSKQGEQQNNLCCE